MNCDDLTKQILMVPAMKTREQIWHAYLAGITDGQALEFGVFKGRSINYMATVRPDARFHGFDSFEGLPEVWKSNSIGHFATNLADIKFRENVVIHTGMFDATLPLYITEKTGRVLQGIHIDCDIGSSTKSVFNHLSALIESSKPLLLFDEMYNYPDYDKHEAGAFCDWVNQNQVAFKIIARTSHEQVLIRLL